MARKKKVEYKVSLKLGDSLTETTGNTMAEAVDSFVLPFKVVTKGVLRVEHGDNVYTTTLQPIRIKRLFIPLAKYQTAKQFTILIKEHV